MTIKIEGLNELQRKLEELSRRVQKLEGPRDVPITELLTSTFLSSCSRFKSVSELFNASGFRLESPADFAAIPDDKWDDFIQTNTTYGSWRQMLSAASAQWAKRELGL